MNFCTQCGSKLDANAMFCGNCGTALKQDNDVSEATPNVVSETEHVVDSDIVSSNHDGLGLGSTPEEPNKSPKRNNNLVKALLVAAVVGIFIFVINMPKELSEAEYTDRVIDILIKNEKAMTDFRREVEASGVDVGFSSEWSRDYLVLQEPAEELYKTVKDMNKDFQKVKAPQVYTYEHETMLKVANAYEIAASNVVSYVETGEEYYEDLIDDYHDMAYEYFEQTIFATGSYEQQFMDRYYEVMEEW